MRLHRRPLVFWSLAVGLAVATALTVSRTIGEAANRAEQLGGLRTVPVAARSVEAGRLLTSDDVALRRLPAAAIPSAPVARSPAGHTTVVPLVPGEVLLQAKLAPWGVQGIAALVPPGRRAMAVPAKPGGLQLRPGHRVDVLATFETAEGAEAAQGADAAEGPEGAEGPPSGPRGGEPTFPVARGALVIDVAEEAVTVAVLPEEAPRVAFAIARGAVTLALTPP